VSHDPQSPTDAADFEEDDYDETDDCRECSGDGGWNSCMEDCCCAIGGEEGCTDPVCWRVCPNCKGTGFI
jgi:hypothetical protein